MCSFLVASHFAVFVRPGLEAPEALCHTRTPPQANVDLRRAANQRISTSQLRNESIVVPIKAELMPKESAVIKWRSWCNISDDRAWPTRKNSGILGHLFSHNFAFHLWRSTVLEKSDLLWTLLGGDLTVISHDKDYQNKLKKCLAIVTIEAISVDVSQELVCLCLSNADGTDDILFPQQS